MVWFFLLNFALPYVNMSTPKYMLWSLSCYHLVVLITAVVEDGAVYFWFEYHVAWPVPSFWGVDAFLCYASTKVHIKQPGRQSCPRSDLSWWLPFPPLNERVDNKSAAAVAPTRSDTSAPDRFVSFPPTLSGIQRSAEQPRRPVAYN